MSPNFSAGCVKYYELFIICENRQLLKKKSHVKAITEATAHQGLWAPRPRTRPRNWHQVYNGRAKAKIWCQWHHFLVPWCAVNFCFCCKI